MDPLQQRVREEARNEPGVYRFTGPRGEVLYVGKSVRLRTRLLDHFRSTRTRSRELLRVARGVEWDPVSSELEALVREFRQIRMFRPRFNVRHRRERRWAWIRATEEAAPRLVASRRPPPGARWVVGPFPGTRSLPRTLRVLAHATGLRDCAADQPIRLADQLDLLAGPMEPGCPRAAFGTCPAPCAGGVTHGAYMTGVREALDFLAGRTDAPLHRLRDRMTAAAKRRSFESAARWRDRHEDLLRLRERVLGHRALLDELSVVLREPPTTKGDPPRLHLLVRARLLDSAPEPVPGSAEALALARRFRDHLDRDGAGTERTESERSREERFVVAEWVRSHPELRDSALPPEEALARLAGSHSTPPAAEGHPAAAMARTCSNSPGSTG